MSLTRRAATTVVAATLITLSLTAAAGGCGSSTAASGSAGAPPGGGVNNICKAATTIPAAGSPGRGVVGGYVQVTCSQVPEVYDLDVYLDWDIDPSDPSEGLDTVDHCYQYDVDQVGTRCTVASACKPGYWAIHWTLTVSIDGAEASSSDSTDYHTKVTKADCAAAA